MKVQREKRSTAVLSTPRPGCFTRGKGPVPMVQETRWAPVRAWTGAENFNRIRSPHLPARSKSLYRLSYTCFVGKMNSRIARFEFSTAIEWRICFFLGVMLRR